MCLCHHVSIELWRAYTSCVSHTHTLTHFFCQDHAAQADVRVRGVRVCTRAYSCMYVCPRLYVCVCVCVRVHARAWGACENYSEGEEALLLRDLEPEKLRDKNDLALEARSERALPILPTAPAILLPLLSPSPAAPTPVAPKEVRRVDPPEKVQKILRD